jgi:short-subunit dehydrogenase
MNTILITGASSGIGRATALCFAKKGWNVIAGMRSPENDIELKVIQNIMVTRLDVEDKESIQESIKLGIESFEEINVLFNNAGHGSMGIFEAATEERIRKQFDVNVFGLMNMTQAVLSHFRARKKGMVINMSSMGGKITLPLMSIYHASKFAVEGFSEAISYELAPHNITVKLIEPGAVNTAFGRRPSDFYFDDKLEDYNQYRGQVMQALGKFKAEMLSPEKVAEVVYLAATDSSSQLRYVVGEDAKSLINLREKSGDEEFIKQISQMF